MGGSRIAALYANTAPKQLVCPKSTLTSSYTYIDELELSLLLFSVMETKLVLKRISKCFIKPRHITQESQQPCYLTPWDLPLLSVDYIQTGLLFAKPQHIATQTLVDQLKDSLSTALTYFFPLSGRLVTQTHLDPPCHGVFLDCKDPQGAEFVHAVADATVSDILSPIDVPALVESFFALHRPINHDGHTLPLLAVQVTELVDGVFIGLSFNHVVADGNSFWHFFNSWSEVARSSKCISRLPVTKRWFLNDQARLINLPDKFIDRFTPEPYRERIFHFTAQSIAQLKAKANADCNTNKISSFQAVAALVWRAATRARGSSGNDVTKCFLVINDRARLDPPLSRDYFGNCVTPECATATVGELLSNNLGWAASLLNKEVAEHTDIKVRSMLEATSKVPSLLSFRPLEDQHTVSFGMSPRFNVYGNDFGWGEPIAVRSGFGIKHDGKVTMYEGCEGGGSMDLEISLVLNSMNALESDDEFMSAVSPTPTTRCFP